MRGLASNLSGLRDARKLMDDVMRQAGAGRLGTSTAAQPPRTALTRVTGFGSNPGNLGMLTYVPERLAPSPALVVVLHGCTQNPAAYNDG